MNHLFAKRMAVSMCGIVSVVIGTLTLYGYITGLEYLSKWAGTTPMAFSTAVAVTLLGIAVTTIGITDSAWRKF